MPYIKRTEAKIGIFLRTVAEATFDKTPADILKAAGADEIKEFLSGETDFIHQDSIDNFIHYLFPTDHDRE